MLEAGGLFIWVRNDTKVAGSTTRHGRAGRQGDPGESRFYLSLEDDLMRIFANDRMAASWIPSTWMTPPSNTGW